MAFVVFIHCQQICFEYMSHMFRDVLVNYVTTESQIHDGGFIFVIFPPGL